jgi:hypothetical protein
VLKPTAGQRQVPHSSREERNHLAVSALVLAPWCWRLGIRTLGCTGRARWLRRERMSSARGPPGHVPSDAPSATVPVREPEVMAGT